MCEQKQQLQRCVCASIYICARACGGGGGGGGGTHRGAVIDDEPRFGSASLLEEFDHILPKRVGQSRRSISLLASWAWPHASMLCYPSTALSTEVRFNTCALPRSQTWWSCRWTRARRPCTRREGPAMAMGTYKLPPTRTADTTVALWFGCPGYCYLKHLEMVVACRRHLKQNGR